MSRWNLVPELGLAFEMARVHEVAVPADPALREIRIVHEADPLVVVVPAGVDLERVELPRLRDGSEPGPDVRLELADVPTQLVVEGPMRRLHVVVDGRLDTRTDGPDAAGVFGPERRVERVTVGCRVFTRARMATETPVLEAQVQIGGTHTGRLGQPMRVQPRGGNLSTPDTWLVAVWAVDVEPSEGAGWRIPSTLERLVQIRGPQLRRILGGGPRSGLHTLALYDVPTGGRYVAIDEPVRRLVLNAPGETFVAGPWIGGVQASEGTHVVQRTFSEDGLDPQRLSRRLGQLATAWPVHPDGLDDYRDLLERLVDAHPETAPIAWHALARGVRRIGSVVDSSPFPIDPEEAPTAGAAWTAILRDLVLWARAWEAAGPDVDVPSPLGEGDRRGLAIALAVVEQLTVDVDARLGLAVELLQSVASTPTLRGRHRRGHHRGPPLDLTRGPWPMALRLEALPAEPSADAPTIAERRATVRRACVALWREQRTDHEVVTGWLECRDAVCDAARARWVEELLRAMPEQGFRLAIGQMAQRQLDLPTPDR